MTKSDETRGGDGRTRAGDGRGRSGGGDTDTGTRGRMIKPRTVASAFTPLPPGPPRLRECRVQTTVPYGPAHSLRSARERTRKAMKAREAGAREGGGGVYP